MVKKEHAIFVFIVILLAFVVQLLSSGFDITGFATGTTAPTITVSNTGPYIGNISVRDTVTITENGQAFMNVSFVVHDDNGAGQISDASARVNITNNGTTTALRFNNTCTAATLNTYTKNYTCVVSIWYFDVPGTWNITAEVNDTALANVTNRSHSAAAISKDFFSIADTTAVVVGPASLTFPAVSVGQDNVTADTNITINNTGNHNSTQGNLALTAVNLRGATDANYIIPAVNFTVNTSSGGSPVVQCNINTTLAFTNNTLVTITNATLGPGNRSLGAMEGVEAYFVCLSDAPANLTGQTYSATGVNAWTVTVN